MTTINRLIYYEYELIFTFIVYSNFGASSYRFSDIAYNVADVYM